MGNGDFWSKVEQGLNKAADWMQNEYERKGVAKKGKGIAKKVVR